MTRFLIKRVSKTNPLSTKSITGSPVPNMEWDYETIFSETIKEP